MGCNGVLLDASYISCEVAEVFHINYASPKFSSCWRAKHYESDSIVMGHIYAAMEESMQ